VWVWQTSPSKISFTLYRMDTTRTRLASWSHLQLGPSQHQRRSLSWSDVNAKQTVLRADVRGLPRIYLARSYVCVPLTARTMTTLEISQLLVIVMMRLRTMMICSTIGFLVPKM
jgi:hypothetical protein